MRRWDQPEFGLEKLTCCLPDGIEQVGYGAGAIAEIYERAQEKTNRSGSKLQDYWRGTMEDWWRSESLMISLISIPVSVYSHEHWQLYA
jgi:hypothetical protein